jgi:hypothetical protein
MTMMRSPYPHRQTDMELYSESFYLSRPSRLLEQGFIGD